MVTTRGGGKPVQRFEEQYESFLKAQFGSRGERRRALNKRVGRPTRSTTAAVKTATKKQAPKKAPAKKPAPKKVAKKATAKAPKPAPKKVAPKKVIAPRTPAAKPKPAATRAAPKPAAKPAVRASAVSRLPPRAKPAATRPPPARAAEKEKEITEDEVSKMVADLKELVQTEKRLEIALVVDGSGSMRRSVSGSWDKKGSTNFDMVRKCLELVPTAFGARNPHVGIIQFGDSSRVELELTDDMTKVVAASKELIFMSSGTEAGLKPAFADAKKMLHGDRGIKKILFFFTDGGSVDDEVVKVSKQMQDDKTTVVVVGVGVAMDRLRQVASDGLAYRLNHFGKLLEVLGTTY